MFNRLRVFKRSFCLL